MENIGTNIGANYEIICENVERAKSKAGRTDKVRIMAVTKTIEVARVNEAISCGVDLLGENRVQEFVLKRGGYSGNCEVHFIGGLQTNKVRQIVGKTAVIQSVDSVKLAREIDRFGVMTDVLIQVNVGEETTKGGVSPEEIGELAGEIAELGNVRLRGLMSIPPQGEPARYFERMQRLYEDLRAGRSGIDTLSMGMSGDYEVAVEFGATMIRVGTALFGRRVINQNKV
jgi:pyridoxal phosphate enzyme (YggS family)